MSTYRFIRLPMYARDSIRRPIEPRVDMIEQVLSLLEEPDRSKSLISTFTVRFVIIISGRWIAARRFAFYSSPMNRPSNLTSYVASRTHDDQRANSATSIATDNSSARARARCSLNSTSGKRANANTRRLSFVPVSIRHRCARTRERGRGSPFAGPL